MNFVYFSLVSRGHWGHWWHWGHISHVSFSRNFLPQQTIYSGYGSLIVLYWFLSRLNSKKLKNCTEMQLTVVLLLPFFNLKGTCTEDLPIEAFVVFWSPDPKYNLKNIQTIIDSQVLPFGPSIIIAFIPGWVSGQTTPVGTAGSPLAKLPRTLYWWLRKWNA